MCRIIRSSRNIEQESSQQQFGSIQDETGASFWMLQKGCEGNNNFSLNLTATGLKQQLHRWLILIPVRTTALLQKENMWETCQGYETMGACREEPPPHALLVQLQCQTGQSIITKTSAYFPIQAMIKCQEARRKSPSWKMVCIWIHLSLTNQEKR